ncbi:MAG: hypothetical protein IJ736_10195, partial [Firmicutes bacterium]|nr:hypothetical protein [Bacillota bacterium]
FESNENRRGHSRKAMLRRFEAAIGNYSKFDKTIIFRDALKEITGLNCNFAAALFVYNLYRGKKNGKSDRKYEK